ncbi:pimeloyl-ACP methyl ester carboxylesterase [Tenacibaculum adriaticum]|uniref:Pimeloyl-ACP methyl ester carboxylesterase n=1 Tax=Tenacibaculum adriaticum TaxID=413713 RepID=A0A5S5DTD2_9FLAO|nr:pimeloyl-ACP methyl ester carboxylesterase [Tenacibaculum adriaticum]
MPSSMSIPNFIKITARCIQFISTKLTVLFAHKLFTSPFNFKTPDREKTMWQSAQKKRIKIITLNKEIDVLSYGYSTKKVLLIHGWSGRSTQLFTVADKLLEKGYMVISFDGPAHGKSEGKQTSMLDFLEAIKQINQEFGPFDSAIGHSFGGMALYNISNELNLKNFVTIGSGDKVSTIINRFIEDLNLKPKIATKLKQFYDKKWNRDVDNHASSELAKQIKIPILVVHDSIDGDVAVSCAVNIRQSLQKGSLLITQGLGHTKILRDKNTMSRVVEFITQNQ